MQILSYIRQSRVSKIVAAILVVHFSAVSLYSPESYALTSGPSQPEYSAFQSAGASNMVDPFTGNFSYNIPLFDIGGYPVNLSYQGGVNMDQEATWAGLGWNVNIGAISREMRGVPDDFNGDEIERKFNIKPNETTGMGLGVGGELVGFDAGGSLGLGMAFEYNNYDGFNIKQTLDVGLGVGNPNKGGLNIGLGLSSDKNGLGIAPNVSFATKLRLPLLGRLGGGVGASMQINSIHGMSSIGLGAGVFRFPMRRSIHFGSPTYIPRFEFPFKNEAFNLELKSGGAISFVDVDAKVNGYGSRQAISQNIQSNRSYGYLYAQNGQDDPSAIHDFNREKDGVFTPNMRYLPVTNHTYDLFDVNAQGMVGTFRAYRNDFGFVYDKKTESTSADGSLAIEANFGNIVDAGINIRVVDMDGQTNVWGENNAAKGKTLYSKKTVNDLKEPFDFYMSSELGQTKAVDMYNRFGKNNPIRFNIASLNAFTDFTSQNVPVSSMNAAYKTQGRRVKDRNIEYLTVREVKLGYPHLAKYIPAYAENHHLGAIIITDADGSRYVFGLPAYNMTYKEITFAASTMGGAITIDADGYVEYGFNDKSVNNNKGQDHFYDENTVGPYAHAWLLTSVLSPDYVDITGNGPSEDDYGTYTKFEYGKEDLYGGKRSPDVKYKWRGPVADADRRAVLNENMKSVKYDDQGNIIYGERDVWYVHTIESKNQIAVFALSNREDGFGVTDINSAAGGNALKRIDKISVYAKEDYTTQGIYAIPIKSVHFVYDYSLCQGVPNNINGNGKLTLKQVYFTYEKSGRAKFSPYTFDYDDNNTLSAFSNPSYDHKAYDRWGNFREYDPNLKNNDYPYVEQDKSVQDQYAGSWALKSITLPSGGRMDIDYESDDYAYVQDKEAARMFKVIGASKDLVTPYNNELFKKAALNSPHLYLFFHLEKPLPGTMGNTDVKNHVHTHYIQGLENNPDGPGKYLYFRFSVSLGQPSPPKYEFVSGFAQIDVADAQHCGALLNSGTNTYEVGWVKVKPVATKDVDSDSNTEPKNTHPITKASWQFSKMHIPRYALSQPEPTAGFGEALMYFFLNSNIFSQIANQMKGLNTNMKEDGQGSLFQVNKSWIRLLSPYGHKQGGGQRVKSIRIHDNWDQMTASEEEADYGQEYLYNLDDGRSSGVASWEPMIGADENIHKIPSFYDVEKTLVPDERFYQELPMGESFFPAPVVGYSRVSVRNIIPSGATITRNATGHSEYHYYTAKDYPTIATSTGIDVKPEKPGFFEMLFGLSYDYVTVSQGHYVEINDMHGRIKEEQVYQEKGGTPVSRKVYNYINDGYKRLGSEADVTDRAGNVQRKVLGMDFDIVADYRESRSHTSSYYIPINVGVSLYGVFPVIAVSVFPQISEEETVFRSACITKVVRRKGILESVDVYDLGAKVTTKNLVFDELTGNVILSEVNNEFNDKHYVLNIPAHWAYDRMGHASHNWGYEFDVAGSGSGINWERTTGEILNSAKNVLQPGDEVLCKYQPANPQYMSSGTTPVSASDHYMRGWVIRNDSDGKKFLANAQGQPITSTSTDNFHFKIIRSGRRNLLNATVQTVELLENPVNNGKLEIGKSGVGNQMKVISTNAVEYSDLWKSFNRQIFRSLYSIEELLPSERSKSLVDAMNLFIQHNTFHTNFGSVDVMALDPWLNNLLGFATNQYCHFNYTSSLATNYTSPITALSNNAYMWLTFSPVCNGDPEESCEMALICAKPSSEITNSDLLNLVNLEIVTSVNTANTHMVALLSQMDLAVPGDLLLQGKFSDGSSAYFILHNIEHCSHIGYNSTNTVAMSLTAGCIAEGLINPYVWGILGNWRPKRTFTFMDERTPASGGDARVRTDGYFTLAPANNFWYSPPVASNFWTINTADQGYDKWRWVSEITNYSPYGPLVENMDVLGNYSAVVYGYKQKLPIVAGQNCMYKELGYDGFEDYITGIEDECVYPGHFRFENYIAQVSSSDAHTGKYSMMVYAGSSVSMDRNTTPANDHRGASTFPFYFTTGDHLGWFAPNDQGESKRYVLSFWVKKNGFVYAPPFIHDYANVIGAEVLLNGTSPLTVTLKSKTELIEGWQKFEYEFNIPSNTNASVRIRIKNDDQEMFFMDDIRVHPFNAVVNSFVYDYRSLKTMATLDENNFATFYEYDQNGSLIRTKKETERGIMTIQENRYNMLKKNINQ